MISNRSPLPQWCSDAKSTLLVDANDAALRFWGYDRDQFIGMPATRLLCEEELPKQLEAANLDRWGETGPWKCRRADGTVLYMTVRWHRGNYRERYCDCVYLVAVGESIESLKPFVAATASRTSL
jgi:PAS domain S-box-containing protein